MTLAEMRQLVGLPAEATDAQVVAAYARLIDDGFPSSVTLVEPVTIEQARAQCRIDEDVDDDLLQQKLITAREWVEDYSGFVVAQRTLVEHFAGWGKFLQITKKPIVSVDAITYTGLDADQLYTGAAFTLGLPTLRIYPSAAGAPRLRAGGAVWVAYTVGYAPTEVPRKFIEAILVLAAGMFDQREGAYAGSMEAAKSLLRLKRRRTL